MSTKVYPYGAKEFAVASGEKISAYSDAVAQIYKKSDGAAPVWSLFKALAAGEIYSSAAVSSATTFRVDSGGDEVLVNTGTDAVVIEKLPFQKQAAPGALNVTGAVTAAMLGSGIITSTTAAAVAGTVPTGTVLDAAFDMEIGDSIDFSVIATGANAFTVTAAAGVTIVGVAVVATVTTGRFRLRKTAAATYIIYRVS